MAANDANPLILKIWGAMEHLRTTVAAAQAGHYTETANCLRQAEQALWRAILEIMRAEAPSTPRSAQEIKDWRLRFWAFRHLFDGPDRFGVVTGGKSGQPLTDDEKARGKVFEVLIGEKMQC